jgi:hypothetical protein
MINYSVKFPAYLSPAFLLTLFMKTLFHFEFQSLVLKTIAESMKESTWIVGVKVSNLLPHRTYTAWPADGDNWWEWGRQAARSTC